MTLYANALTTYTAKGNREDLVDKIYRIDPTDTPFMSGVDKNTATAVTHEWQTQALAAASTSNQQLEGDVISVAAVTASVRLTNICEIARASAAVTGTQQVVQHAGRDDEMAFQEMLKALELKRDMESSLAGSNVAKNAGNATTARVKASVLSWIKTNTDKGSAGGAADPAAADGTGTRTDGTQRVFTEAQLKNVLKLCWDSGGKPDVVMTGSFNKQVASTFTGRSTPTEDTAKRKITAAVDVYASDFGQVRLVPNRFTRSRDVLVLQMDMWAVSYLTGRKFVSFELARTGDALNKVILSEFTLEARNEKSSGGVFDLTTS